MKNFVHTAESAFAWQIVCKNNVSCPTCLVKRKCAVRFPKWLNPSKTSLDIVRKHFDKTRLLEVSL